MEDEAPEGGEASCYLSRLDDEGHLFDPRDAIRLGPEADARGAADVALPVRIGPNSASHLAPLRGESLEEYRRRLETPACRTAAWQIALQSQEQPVTLIFEADHEHGYGPILVDYLRSLIA